LGKTRAALGSKLGVLLKRDKLDADFYQGVEETLVAADVGVHTSSELVEAVQGEHPGDPAEAMELVADRLVALFAGRSRSMDLEGEPAVILVVGVNGGGKTTSIAKLAAQLEAAGSSVVLGAADTYRAAADQQLRVWADRLGVPIVAGADGADPASVAFDAFSSTRARGADVLIVDTAGRLQNQANLMSELTKLANVLRREAGRIDEVLLVIDGTTGQNAISQARSFTAAVGVTGVILTKLDGTARGGVAVAVEQALDVPVKYIGVGEGIFDLVPFDPEEFVDALVGS
jgi:fused signal recognition particle receptor